MAKVIIHPLFEQKLHEYVEEAYEVYGRKTARRWMAEIDKIKSFFLGSAVILINYFPVSFVHADNPFRFNYNSFFQNKQCIS